MTAGDDVKDQKIENPKLVVIALEAPATEADSFTAQSIEELEIESKQAENQRLKDDNELRKAYASKVFFYLVAYSVLVGAMIIADGFSWFGFELDSQVASYLVGSTAVSAIGLVASVTMGLFGKK